MLLFSFQALYPCGGASDQMLGCPDVEIGLGATLDDFCMNLTGKSTFPPTGQDGKEIAFEIPGLPSLHTEDFLFSPLSSLTRAPSISWPHGSWIYKYTRPADRATYTLRWTYRFPG